MNWDERLTGIARPLLTKLAEHYKSPHLAYPDIIEFSSALWDTRAWTERDFKAKGFGWPYPSESNVAFTDLSTSRTDWWGRTLRENVRKVARAFPEFRDRPGRLLWRLPHHGLRNHWTPYNRVFVLEQLGRYEVGRLKEEERARRERRGRESWMSKFGLFGGGGGRGRDDVELQGREGWDGDGDRGGEGEEDLRLDERLDVDEWGPMILGQEHKFLDPVHPGPVPCDWLWMEMIFYELSRDRDPFPQVSLPPPLLSPRVFRAFVFVLHNPPPFFERIRSVSLTFVPFFGDYRPFSRLKKAVTSPNPRMPLSRVPY